MTENKYNDDGRCDPLLERLLDSIQRQKEIQEQLALLIASKKEALSNFNPEDFPAIAGSSCEHQPSNDIFRYSLVTQTQQSPNVLKRNALFITAVAILSAFIVLLSLISSPRGLKALNQRSQRIEAEAHANFEKFDKMSRERDATITLLQQKLTDTESALRQNETALREAQNSLKEFTESERQSFDSDASSKPIVEPMKSEYQAPVAEADGHIKAQLIEVSSAITANENSLRQNASALADSRLALFNDKLAERILKGSIKNEEAILQRKLSADFWPGMVSATINRATNVIRAIELVKAETLPDDSEKKQSRIFTHERLLSEAQLILKEIEREITTVQLDIVQVQKDIETEQKAISLLRDSTRDAGSKVSLSN